MKGVNDMNAFTSMLSKTVTKVKVKTIKHGPAIAITLGLAGMAGTVYLTYKAATKIEQDKRERNENLNLVDIYEENGSIDHEDGSVVAYSEEDAANDRKIYNTRFWVNCVKHAAPAVGLFILSSFLIYKGFKTEAKRLAAMGTAVAGLTAQIADIRSNLENEFGKEKANDIMLGKHTHTETEISEDGEVTSKEVTTTNRFVTGYTFEFSKDSSPNLWTGVYKTDKDFIEGNMRRANWLLNEKHGYVFFNEILDDFDIKIVGYGNTDGMIAKFGEQRNVIYDVDERKTEDGQTYFIITIANMDGYILDKI